MHRWPPLRPSTPSELPRLRTIRPHPLMLQVANLGGEPKPEFEQWRHDLLNLEADTLIPCWFPHSLDGIGTLTERDRADAFAEYFEMTYRMFLPSAPRPASGFSTVPPTENSRPQRVLKALIELREIFPPHWTPARD